MVPPLMLNNKIICSAGDVDASFAPFIVSDFMKERVPDANEMWLTRWPEVASLRGHQRELGRSWTVDRQQRRQRRRHHLARLQDGGLLDRGVQGVDDSNRGGPDDSLVLLVLENGIIKLVDPETAQIV
jgi:hypothetical protein